MGNFAIGPAATSFLLSLGFLSTVNVPALHAQSDRASSGDVEATIDALELAANNQELETVLGFYGENFTHSDGLSRDRLGTGLTDLWEQYQDLRYEIEVDRLDVQGQQIIAHTLTTISGSRNEGQRPVRLQSQVESRQYIDRVSRQILRQDVLAERTFIYSGVNPPNLNINLPAEVGTGEAFDFDVIVEEPLNGDLLLGGAIEMAAVEYAPLETSQFELELLQAGGIFKRGTAPQTPDDQRLAAIVIRDDGITLFTQRLKINAQ